MEKTVKVPDMSCQHCVKRIQKSLDESQVVATVDLDSKSVSFNGDESVAIEAIVKAGYTVEK
ncbi:MAG: heavy-metal-associated domain-containing protein [Erysipelothrix sp.]|nr:heavy-metal-associated domain-containing protein [Erysipelothrix sp.]